MHEFSVDRLRHADQTPGIRLRIGSQLSAVDSASRRTSLIPIYQFFTTKEAENH